jgi:hypothetical protein
MLPKLGAIGLGSPINNLLIIVQPNLFGGSNSVGSMDPFGYMGLHPGHSAS